MDSKETFSSPPAARLSARSLLCPFSGLYGLITSTRNYLYDHQLLASQHAALPVLCVGNVTLGGSGKSPFTIFLAEELFARGHRPVVLSRGYRGRIVGPHLVTAADLPEQVGDEAVMHRSVLDKKVPVVIARDRSSGSRYITEEQLGDVILLDDGFQHRRLQRDLNFLLLDISSPTAINRWASGQIIPCGYLREHFDQALKRTDAVVFTSRGSAPSELLEDVENLQVIPAHTPSCAFSIYPTCFVDAFSQEQFPLTHFSGTRARGITAIANPEPFRSMLLAEGVTLDSYRTFRDHYHYSERDWLEICQEYEGPVFTTAKDAVKLKTFLKAPGQLYVLNLGVRMLKDCTSGSFWNLVETRIKQTEKKRD